MITSIVNKKIEEFQKLLQNCVCTTQQDLLDLDEAMELFVAFLTQIKEQGKQLFAIGNGKSGKTASSFSTSLIKEVGISAHSLFEAELTSSIASEYGFAEVYRYPLKTLLKEGDLLIALSPHGKSSNILNAAKEAETKEALIITLSGGESSNPLRQMGDLNIWIDSANPAVIDITHQILLEAILSAVNIEG